MGKNSTVCQTHPLLTATLPCLGRFQPCNPDAEFSSCCALNGTSGQNDICMDSGLCMSTSGWFSTFLYANGCTGWCFSPVRWEKVSRLTRSRSNRKSEGVSTAVLFQFVSPVLNLQNGSD